jgi:holo-[acyl-carrier protein] synthase
MKGDGVARALNASGPEAAADLLAGGALAPAVSGVGIDAVDLERFARVLGRRPGMADRLFTSGELAYARSAADPVPRMSTRFAAKEATMKALGVGLGAFPFVDVEVVRTGLEAPRLVLYGAALGLAREAGVVRWHLSLTHTDGVALALVVAERGGRSAPAAGAGPAPEPAAGRPSRP